MWTVLREKSELQHQVSRSYWKSMQRGFCLLDLFLMNNLVKTIFHIIRIKTNYDIKHNLKAMINYDPQVMTDIFLLIMLFYIFLYIICI